MMVGRFYVGSEAAARALCAGREDRLVVRSERLSRFVSRWWIEHRQPISPPFEKPAATAKMSVGVGEVSVVWLADHLRAKHNRRRRRPFDWRIDDPELAVDSEGSPR